MHLYLAQHKNIPHYTKIGFTDNIEQRMLQLNTASPTGIVMIYTQETDYAYQMEQALHRRYSAYNSNLEWFQLTPEQIEEIKTWINQHIERYNERYAGRSNKTPD